VARFSNIETECEMFCAGSKIYATLQTTNTNTGTSMAANTAGVAALIRSIIKIDS
jgi:hypothetical protein